MKYRIKHQSPTYAVIAIVCMMFMIGTVFVNDILSFKIMYVFYAIMLLAIFFNLIESAVGVTVIGEDSYMIIKSLWRRKRIDFDQITDVTTKRYKKRRRYRYDIRMKMTISLANGKKVVLNDNAGEFRGVSSFLRSNPFDKPDEEVPLYQVCQMIRSKIGYNFYY